MKHSVFNLFSIIFITIILFTLGCSKSTEVGLDLFDEDQVGVLLIDTLKINATTVRQDSVPSPDYTNLLRPYPSGNFNDPIFGRTEAGFYMQMVPATSFDGRKLIGATIDSVVLSLKYDTLSFGDITSSRAVAVYRMTEELLKQTYFSNKTFATESNQLTFDGNAKVFIPRIKNKASDSVQILSYLSDTAKLKLAPHLRIRLTNDLGKEILADTTALKKADDFKKVLKGLYIKPTSEDKGLIAFLLNKADNFSTSFNTQTNLNIYFRDNTGKKNIFVLYADVTNAVKSVKFVAQPSTILSQAINNPAIGDSILYIQGMNGPDIKVTLPHVKTLAGQNLIVNKGELEMFIKPTPDAYITPPQLIIRKTNIGAFSKDDAIADVVLAGNVSATYRAFGGKPEKVTINGETLLKYTFNVSAHLQQMIDNASMSDSFYISFDAKSSTISRAVFYGAKHQKYPMKLKLYCTKL
jgi:hypothetical protein